jgi:hypothetical protein
VTEIERALFDGCSSLTAVTISETVTTIGAYAFARCTSLARITIPDAVTSLGMLAFWQCHALKLISFPDTLRLVDVARCVPPTTNYETRKTGWKPNAK